MAHARFLHTADLHLSRAFGFLPPQLAVERRRDQRRTLARIAELALERDVDFLLVSGDLFDRPNPDPTDLEAVVEHLGRVGAAGKRVFVIPGNHDHFAPGGVWTRLDLQGVHVFVEPEFQYVALDDLGIALAGIAFDRSKSERRAFENLELPRDVPCLLLVHASYESFEGQIERYHPFSQGELAEVHVPYVALGHYHRLNVMTSGDTVACYPGAPEGLSFDHPETDERYVVIGELGDDGVALETVQVNRRVMRSVEIDCTSFESAAAVENAVRKLCDPNALLRIRLCGAPPQDLAARLEEISDRFRESCLYLSIDSASLACPKDVPVDERTIRGRFCKHLLERIENSPDSERQHLLKRALELGLAAFSEE